jgi:hypothetical protein
LNAEVWRYNFYLYQLELMKKAEFVRIDNPSETVNLAGTYGFCPIKKDKPFSPLLVTPNINTELEGFTESYEQLMSLPNNEDFAEELYQSAGNLYVAKGYSSETIQNNMVMQLLLENKYINFYDLTRGRITEKVNREILAAAKHVAVRKFEELNSETIAHPINEDNTTPPKPKKGKK